MSLSLVFATAIQAQKFQNKGDLKPVIENIFIWHATHTEANIDRSSNTAMGVGIFNDNSVSGTETSNSSDTNIGGDNNTNSNVENDDVTTDDSGEVIQTDEENDNSTISINPSGLLTENNSIPSRGGNNEGGITPPNNTGNNNSHPIDGDRQGNILEEILNYPNPASEEINIMVPLMDELVRIRLINLSGQPVIDQKAYSNSRVVLDTYHLPEGVYLLEFTGSGKQLFRRTYIKK
ncbi:MAG: T9SS type A sorting domain-containing protein [Chitinophagales bacterium]